MLGAAARRGGLREGGQKQPGGASGATVRPVRVVAVLCRAARACADRRGVAQGQGESAKLWGKAIKLAACKTLANRRRLQLVWEL